MQAGSNLTNHFLIAMPALDDPYFSHTVTYICEHTSNGAMGIIINQPLEMHLADIFEHMKIDFNNTPQGEQLVHYGGPVEEDRGFVLHNYDHNWDSTMQITENMAISTSRDILESIAQGKGPQNYFIALGFAGWSAGQLEREISENSWLSGPANEELIFKAPLQDRWREAAQSIGVDLNLLSAQAGHA
jgi:putative transcriptional regulator